MRRSEMSETKRIPRKSENVMTPPTRPALAEQVAADIERATRQTRFERKPIYDCANPACRQKVSWALYCCAGCRLAHEGGYEVHEDGPLGHSDICKGRGTR